MKNQNTIVIGAGIVGVAAAIWLKRAGHHVTLIDKGEPGMGASYGNGGILASAAIVPVTAPGMGVKGPKMLLDPDFPLFLRWSYLPRLIPWLLRYISHANDSDTQRIATGLMAIVGDSVEQHLALTAGTEARKWVRESDYSFAYADRAAFAADAYSWGIRRKWGFVPSLIEGNEVQDVEPILGPEIRLLATLKNHGFILNPGSYVAHLAWIFQQMGGDLVRAEVRDFDLSGGRIGAVDTDQGRFSCDQAVLATGVWSKPLMKKLGLNVPLEAERGYHIVFNAPSIRPNNPMMISSGKFVVAAMDTGLRCAGIVEFGGLKAGPSKPPFDLLRRKVKQSFPDLTWQGEEEWMGFRPAPSDSLPLIGEVGASGVFAAFGHHHIGLTGGPKTGRLVADLITGVAPNIDLRPFAPGRFGVRR